MLWLQIQTAFLGADQTVLHHMGDADPGIHPHNPGGALERVRSAHASLKLVRLGRVSLQRQQTGIQYLGLRLGLKAEQLKQRGVAHLLGGHVRLRVIALSS